MSDAEAGAAVLAAAVEEGLEEYPPDLVDDADGAAIGALAGDAGDAFGDDPLYVTDSELGIEFDEATAVAAARFPSSFSLCTRVSVEEGVGTWSIVGPALPARRIDPLQFTHVVVVRGAASLTSREIYVRACGRLVACGMYASLAATHHSILLVARNINVEEPAGLDEPSWSSVASTAMSPADTTGLLCRAGRATQRTRTGTGLTVVDVKSVATHPWRLYALRQRDRRVARRAVAFYRRRVGEIVQQDSGIVGVLGSNACSRLRRALELVGRPKDGSVSKRVRVSHGCTMPRLLPSRSTYATMKRTGVDKNVTVAHRLWVLDAAGEVEAWTYKPGSAATGERYYTLEDGREMRLGANGVKRSATCFSVNGDDDADLGTAHFADQDTNLAADLKISTNSYIESLDGTERLKVVALEFDGPALVQRAIDEGLDPNFVGDPRGCANVITVAADGGPVCRRTLTVVTLTLSTEFIIGSQSPLLPMLFILGGEGQLHSGIGRRLRPAIAAVMDADYRVPTRAPANDEHTPPAVNDDSNPPQLLDGDESPLAQQPLSVTVVRPQQLLRLVADFAMQGHLLALTGGADMWRCPSGYPCLVADMGSPSAPSWLMTRPRTVASLETQWLLSVWSFSRWCALRSKSWVCGDGVIGVPCRDCGLVMAYESLGATHLACRTEGCALIGVPQGELMPTLPKSAMGLAFRSARRTFGGVRGFPILPDLPIAVQHPLLHCTSNIIRMIVFFMLAWFTRQQADTARASIYEFEGKTNMGAMYGREFRALVAKLLACPDMLGVPIDSAILMLMSLAQLLSAAWRKAVGRGSVAEREASAAILELAAKLLAPLFALFKRLDPETKDKGVFNLYVHAAAAHAREHTGRNAPPVPLVSDDDIEGIIRQLNTYFKTRTSNISRVEALVDMHAIFPYVTEPTRARFSAEAGIYTASIRVCACAAGLGPTLQADFKHAEALAANDVALSVAHSVGSNGADVTTFTLPASVRETEQTIMNNVYRAEDETVVRLGIERRIALALVQRQAVVDICFCGNLGGEHSVMANVLLTTPLPPETCPGGAPDPTSGEPVPDSDNVEALVPAAAGGLAPHSSGDASVPRPIFMEQPGTTPSEITPFLPPVALRRRLFGGEDEASIGDAGEWAAAAREELTMVEMCVTRTQTEHFQDWCSKNAADATEIRHAAEKLQLRLIELLADSTSAVVHVV